MPVFSKIHSFALTLRRQISGATAIEYALIAGGIALGIAVVVFTMGDTLEMFFGTMSDQLDESVEIIESRN